MTTHIHRTSTVTARINTTTPTQPATAPPGKPARRPYTADNVAYVDQGGIITAVWVSDPTITPAVALKNILHTNLPYQIEVIAEATRFYKRDGAAFSGWIITTEGGLHHSDPILNKPKATAQLRHTVTARFQRGAHA